MTATNKRRPTSLLNSLGYGGRGPSAPLLIALAIIWLATGFQQCGVLASASSVADRRRGTSMPSRHNLLAAAASRKSRDVRYSDSRTVAIQPSQTELRTLVEQTGAQAERHYRQPSTEFLFDPDSFSPSLSSSGTYAQRRNLKHPVEGRQLQSSPLTARSSRRKKLKADVFYAMRGRRGYDPLEDSSEQEVGKFDEEPLIDTETKSVDGKADVSRLGIDGMWGQAASLAINDGDDGNQRVTNKREPPNGFHAIRGKRHLQF